MSANLPKGIIRTAVARTYAVTIQPSRTASADNSLPMEGMATVIADPMKGVIKAPTVAVMRTAFLLMGLSARSPF